MDISNFVFEDNESFVYVCPCCETPLTEVEDEDELYCDVCEEFIPDDEVDTIHISYIVDEDECL